MAQATPHGGAYGLKRQNLYPDNEKGGYAPWRGVWIETGIELLFDIMLLCYAPWRGVWIETE